jgi:polyphosphate kinase
VKHYRPKELSWTSFNARVLQEAFNPEVPLSERIKFLGIYSSNLDEFFEIRVANLKRVIPLGKKASKLSGDSPRKILAELQKINIRLNAEFSRCYAEILGELGRRGIYIVDECGLGNEQIEFLHDYFNREVRQYIFPVMLDRKKEMPVLKDRSLYLMIELIRTSDNQTRYSIVEVPEALPRFVILPKRGKEMSIILIDDVVRFGFPDIFRMFEFDSFRAYNMKLTCDAELNLDDDLTESLVNKISKSLKKRHIGEPVRISYDETIPDEMFRFFLKKMKLRKGEIFVPGGRYHNFKDFISFPKILPPEDTLPNRPSVMPKAFAGKKSFLSVIRERDVMLHLPYHSFDIIIDLLREASMDEKVTDIMITLYRVAKNSSIANALVNARKNGKHVTVLMEIQARFDETNNIRWAEALKAEGADVILGIPGLKVHSKLCVINRKENGRSVSYAVIGTGNFNENTARIYTDHFLLTSDNRVTKDIAHVFSFFKNNFLNVEYRHLLVSPFNMRKKIITMIDNETSNADKGRPAYIYFVINNLVDPEVIKHLYRAGQSGVKIRLMVRGMFSLVTGIKGVSDNIEARGIVDKYLEHSRCYLFGNGGEEKCYITSADLMSRNLDSRIEIAVPVLDKEVLRQLRGIIEIMWRDNVKARILDTELRNEFRETAGDNIRAQDAIYEYIRDLESDEDSENDPASGESS